MRLPTCDGRAPDDDPEPDGGAARSERDGGDERDAFVVPPPPDAGRPPLPPCTFERPPARPSCQRLLPTEVPPTVACAPDPTVQIEPDGPAPDLGEPLLGPRDVAARFRLIGLAAPEPVQWHLEGWVPGGLWLDTCTGELGGTLEWPVEGDLAVVALVGTGDACRFTRTLLVTEPPPPLESEGPVVLPPAQVGVPYAEHLEGDRVRPHAPLPPGLDLDCTTGQLVGTPTEAGDFTIHIGWLEYSTGRRGEGEARLRVVP